MKMLKPTRPYRKSISEIVEENEWQIKIEEKIWEADREFEEWREKQAPALAALKVMYTLSGVK